MKTKQMRPVAILAGSRTPFTKSFTHYSKIPNKKLLTATLKNLVEKTNIEGVKIGDVAAGAVMKNAEDWNLTRESVLKSGLHPHTPAYDVQRACGTSLETTAHIALKIASGQIESGIAAGTDTNSDITGVLPHEFSWLMMEFNNAKDIMTKIKILSKFKPQYLLPQFPVVKEPQTGLSMGEHTELIVKEWKISRDAQDLIALNSHQNAHKAYENKFFDDLMFEFNGLKKDSILRADTTLEKLAKLKPAFDKTGSGTLTAGNSTALTDGASAVLLGTEEFAQKHNLNVLAYFVDCEYSAVDFVKGEGLLMAPTIAISNLLKRNELSFSDIDFFEIHEAFAGQVAATLKAWESPEYNEKVLGRKTPLGVIDPKKINVNGGSLALGHPFAATGTRIVASLAKTINQKGSGLGIISICTAGGMGVAALIQK